MRTIKELSKEEQEEILNSFYASFETGFAFEEFLKPFLESIGLSEVEVTKKTGDGGVDLTAVRNGLTELSGSDFVIYKVQAKRYKPSTTINPEQIDALRGNLKTNEKGLFITTGKVSEKAKSDAMTKDEHRPVIVIDGKDLVATLIDKGIGFSYKPTFSSSALDDFIGKKKEEPAPKPDDAVVPDTDAIMKMVTSNDIRARILSVPSSIVDKLDEPKTKQPVVVVINGTKKYNATFCPSRNYLGSVTAILKDCGMIKEDGTFSEKKIYWKTNGKDLFLTIE